MKRTGPNFLEAELELPTVLPCVLNRKTKFLGRKLPREGTGGTSHIHHGAGRGRHTSTYHQQSCPEAQSCKG